MWQPACPRGFQETGQKLKDLLAVFNLTQSLSSNKLFTYFQHAKYTYLPPMTPVFLSYYHTVLKVRILPSCPGINQTPKEQSVFSWSKDLCIQEASYLSHTQSTCKGDAQITQWDLAGGWRSSWEQIICHHKRDLDFEVVSFVVSSTLCIMQWELKAWIKIREISVVYHVLKHGIGNDTKFTSCVLIN